MVQVQKHDIVTSSTTEFSLMQLNTAPLFGKHISNSEHIYKGLI